MNQKIYPKIYTQTFLDNLLALAKALLVFGMGFLLIFVLLNFQAIFLRAKYSLKNEIKKEEKSRQVIAPSNLTKQKEVPKIISNRLIISKIGIDAPIIWNVIESEMKEKLKEGVVHFKGTALPDKTGNIAIIGHSSNYPWERGNYNQVFALLDKLEIGDRINLTYQGKKYSYKVKEKMVVLPSQVSVLYPTKNKTLTLITCVPIGTNQMRLVIRSEII